MAEFVQFRAEEWVRELEQMERIGLFEPKEIKSIVTKRKEFEYKIHRISKCQDDYMKYIQFEIDLNRIIKARRKKTGIKAKKAEIDYNQTFRIGKLFKHAIFKFPNDMKLWMSFFKFCEKVKLHSLVSHMLIRMLQIHSNKADLWVFAARWEFQQCHSIDNARQFLTTGLRHHPGCVALYQELFKLELESLECERKKVEKKIKKDETFKPDVVTENIIEGRVAEVIFDSAIKEIGGVDFKVTLFNIAVKNRAPKALKDKIFRTIVKNHLDEELTWDMIANEEFKGFSRDLNQLIAEEEKKVEAKETETPDTNKVTMRDRIQRSISIYEEAIRKFNSVKMWSYYLDFVIKLNKKSKRLKIFKSKLLRNAMKGAMVSGNMAEKYYIRWITKLQKTGAKSIKLSEVLKKGTEHHPKSLKLWYGRLKFCLCRDSEELVMEVFKEAIENFPDATPLWSLVVKHLLLKSSPKVEEVLKDGIKRRGEVAQTLKPLYIEWLVQTKGIEKARLVFESSEMNLYPCLELYQKMAALELNQTQPCLNRVRRCHELACAKFGENKTGVWLDYVKFEIEKGLVSQVALLHSRALKALKPESADEFLAEFNKFKMNLFT